VVVLLITNVCSMCYIFVMYDSKVLCD